ncbi:MAG: transketolase, partial [Candidatus Omnitrophica bacterium]|nr:transketolase [Candidatus Omnitrophota bacterium]
VEAHGHHFQNFNDALDQFGRVKDKPFMIIAHTIKGKGISFMEGEWKWHGKAPNDEELAAALAELEQ